MFHTADEPSFGRWGGNLVCVRHAGHTLGDWHLPQHWPYLEQWAGLHAGLHAHCAASQLLLTAHLHRGRQRLDLALNTPPVLPLGWYRQQGGS